MQTNYHIFHRRQDIGKRISLLHREETLSIGMIAVDNGENLAVAIDSLLARAGAWTLHVLMYEEQGRLPELRSRFPEVTYIVFTESVSFGTMANALANECHATFFLLTRSDLQCLKLELQQSIQHLHRSDKPSVITPVLTNRLQEPIPVIQAPLLRSGMIDPISFFPSGHTDPTLYPFLGVGLYERALFQRLRGFDEQLEGEYWQQHDFGISSRLYG